MIALISTGLAIIGALYVAHNKSLMANIIWSVANPLLVIYNYSIGEYEQMVMFVVFTAIAWYGVWNLKLRSRTQWKHV